MVVKIITKIKIPHEYVIDHVENLEKAGYESKLVEFIKNIEKEFEVDGVRRYYEITIDEDLEKIAKDKPVDEITDEDILYYAYSKRKDIYIVIKEEW